MSHQSEPRLFRKNLPRRGVPIVALLALGGFCSCATAQILYYDGGGGNWNPVNNWSTASNAATPNPSVLPGSLDVVHFNISTVNGNETVTLTGAETVKGVVIGNTGTTFLTSTAGGGDKSLTIGTSGIVVNAGAGAATLHTLSTGLPGVLLSGAQTWSNQSGSLFTVSSIVNNQGHQITSDGTGNTAISGPVSGAGGLVKSGASVLTLSGVNLYTGSTTVSGGTLSVAGTGNVLPNSSAVVMNGGTLAYTGGSLGAPDQAGSFQLLSNSTINNGTGLSFADSSAVAWTAGTFLSIWNWTTGTIRFGTTSGGLSPAQLANIRVYTQTPVEGGYSTPAVNSSGYLVTGVTPVPEPGAVLGGLLLLGGIGWRERHHVLRMRRPC